MKKALCIGVSNFQIPDMNPLSGCVNDAKLVAAILEQCFGYTEEGVRLLTDNSATRSEVLEGLEWLVYGASDGDVLVLTIASHGTWSERRNSDTQPEQESPMLAKDRVIVTYDYSDTILLLDSEINAILDQIPEGVNCYCLMDVCHAGLATGIARDEVQRPRASNVRHCQIDQNQYATEPVSIPGESRYDIFANRVVIYGCADDEQSYDVPTSIGYHGLLTLSLCQTLSSHSWNVDVRTAFDEVRDRVHIAATAMKFTQNPQLIAPSRLMNNHLLR